MWYNIRVIRIRVLNRLPKSGIPMAVTKSYSPPCAYSVEIGNKRDRQQMQNAKDCKGCNAPQTIALDSLV
jgi:restriction endonuclease